MLSLQALLNMSIGTLVDFPVGHPAPTPSRVRAAQVDHLTAAPADPLDNLGVSGHQRRTEALRARHGFMGYGSCPFMPDDGEQRPQGPPEYYVYRSRRGLFSRLRSADLSRPKGGEKQPSEGGGGGPRPSAKIRQRRDVWAVLGPRSS